MLYRISIFVIFLLFEVSGLPVQQLKVMSYNIHHGRNDMGQVDLPAIAEVIKKSGADLVGLQEVDSICRRSGNVDQMRELGKLTGMYFDFEKHMDFDGGAYGLGILSKFPIKNVQNYRLSFSSDDIKSDNRLLLVADVQINKSITVHFANVHFDHREDPAIRGRQSSETMNYLEELNLPVILTGDLNAESEKPEISNLFQIFTDSDTAGAFTFPADEPAKKIDYILISKPHLKKLIEHEVINEPVASDHRPVVSTFVLKKK